MNSMSITKVTDDICLLRDMMGPSEANCGGESEGKKRFYRHGRHGIPQSSFSQVVEKSSSFEERWKDAPPRPNFLCELKP